MSVWLLIDTASYYGYTFIVGVYKTYKLAEAEAVRKYGTAYLEYDIEKYQVREQLEEGK